MMFHNFSGYCPFCGSGSKLVQGEHEGEKKKQPGKHTGKDNKTKPT